MIDGTKAGTGKVITEVAVLELLTQVGLLTC